jgi:hypothetical protein
MCHQLQKGIVIMFNIPQEMTNQFKEMYESHRLYVNTCNIYLHTIRLINGKHKYLTKEDYEEYYQNITKDIEMNSHPLDAFIPNDNVTEEEPSIFVVNRCAPEWERIKKRVTVEDAMETLPGTHPAIMALRENPHKIDILIDDVFIYFCIYKYMHQIEMVRLNDISAMTPVIEYVVNHIDYKTLKDYLSTKKINEDKCNKYWEDAFFIPDMRLTKNFYEDAHDGIEPFDAENLIKRLLTNLILKTDIHIIVAIYLVLSYSRVDIMEGNFDNSPNAKYVRDVLSIL